jgi:hypothetical protein
MDDRVPISRYQTLDTKNCLLGRYALDASHPHLDVLLFAQRGGEARLICVPNATHMKCVRPSRYAYEKV